MKIADFLAGKTVFVTGATGFLGQPLVEKILWSAPEVRRIYVLIRPKYQFGGRIVEAQQRLEKELYGSNVFERLQGRYSDDLGDFLREKLVAVAGDISRTNLGIDDDEKLDRLRNEVDVVVNSAAVVSFDAPLDEALQLNALAARRVSEFAAGCSRVVLVHVSTAYVCGAATGSITETIHHQAPPECDERFPERQISDLDGEISAIKEIIERVREASQAPEVERKLKAKLLRQPRRGRKSIPSKRRDRLETLRRKWVSERLVEEGMKWARQRGWNDTYTYTKALGEQMVLRHRGEVPTAIIRPSVIESSLSEPSPGWLDGLRMADPLIVAIGKGRLRSLPLNPDVSLDLVPVDMVVNTILAVMPRLQKDSPVGVYHVATGAKNPVMLGELYDLIDQYFRQNPMLDRDGNPIKIRRLRFPNPSAFRIQHRLKQMQLDTAEKTLEKFPVFDATERFRRRLSATRVAHQKLYYYGEIYEPYLNLNCVFQVENTMKLYEALDEEEKKRFNFDIRRLNWRHYVQNVHIPGVKKFILKIEGTGSLELTEETLSDAPVPSTIIELLNRSAERFPDKTALQIRRKKRWVRYSYSQVKQSAETVASRFLRLGLKKGDRVLLYSENQPEWGITYLGASLAGLVVVPLDAQTWNEEVWSTARFTSARALLVSERCFKRLSPEQLKGNEGAESPILLLSVEKECEPLQESALPISSNPEEADGPHGDLPEIRPDDEASIIFTAGTVVDPRGVVHTHRNFIRNLVSVNHYLAISDSDQLLSVLPLYHALEFTCGFLMSIYGGATVTYVQSLKPRALLDTMRETGTTCMLGVPTLYALIREDIERRILKTSRSGFKSNWFETSKNLSQSLERRLGHNLGRKIFARVHEEFGGKIRVLVSGGSSLGEDLYRYFKTLGMPIYEGYGLTETAPVLTVNPLHRSREGSAGRPVPGVELRLFHPDRDGIGEIIVRTPSLMKGYFRNERATEEVVKDGWLHTGDKGWVDADGYVYVTGRIKDVIVTGAGKNVYPTDLEAIYQKSIPEIREICVVGLRSGLTEDVHAVIVATENPAGQTPEEKSKGIQRQIQELARELPSYHRLQGIHLWTKPLPRTESGALDRERIRRELSQGRDKDRPAEATRRTAEKSKREQLIAELSRLSGEPSGEITEGTQLYTDLGLDSLMAVELLLFIEQRFGVAIADEKATNFQTVGDILEELKKRGVRERAGPESDSLDLARVRSTRPLGERPISDRVLMAATFSAMKAIFRSYFRLTVKNESLLPKEGAYIVAANHCSHLDAGAVISALGAALGIRAARRLHVVGAKDYFFDTPLRSWFFSSCLNVVPLDREELSLGGVRMVRSILSRGEPVLIFPEGTRSRNGSLQRFKPGIGLIAYELRVPIVPVHIEGTHSSMAVGQPWPRPAKITVSFGVPVEMEPYIEDAKEFGTDELYRRIADDVRDAVADLAHAVSP